jgi:methionyl-tRNA formyltransferase
LTACGSFRYAVRQRDSRPVSVCDGDNQMPREIVLLTGAREAPYLGDFLRRHNSGLRVSHAATRDDLALALHPRRPGVRLIAFCTAVVVPAALLAEVDGPSYNFHPGPPTHPGRHPASFAIYENASRFAATAHEMQREVDSGAIVGVEWFDMPPQPRLSQLEGLTYEASLRLFARLAPALATSDAPLPHLDQGWTGRKSTQRDFDAMCELQPDIEAPELDRRARAFADGLDGKLHLKLHGRIFRLEDK